MRVHFIPCGPFANESERLAVERLKAGLVGLPGEEEWILLSNLAHSVSSQGQSDEIDLVTISSRGVLVLEIKHWGWRYLDENRFLAEQEAERLAMKARRVATKLRRRFPPLGFVEGRFLLTNQPKGQEARTGTRVRGAPIYSLTDWQALLDVGAPPRLRPEVVQALCRELEPLSQVSLQGELRRFGSLVDLELLSDRNDRFHRVFRGRHAVRQDRVVLHLYDLSAFEGKNAREVAAREFDALQALQKSPHVPPLLDSFQDAPGYPGELCFFSLVDPSVPSVGERSGDASWDLPDRLRFAAECAKALAELHATVGLPAFVHRNITPEAVLVRADGSPVFTGFDLAKVPAAASLVGSPAEASLRHPFCAPEVARSGLAAADQEKHRGKSTGVKATLLTHRAPSPSGGPICAGMGSLSMHPSPARCRLTLKDVVYAPLMCRTICERSPRAVSSDG